MSLRVAGLAALETLLLAGALPAQVRGSLDLGAGTYRPDRAIAGGVASIAPTVSFETDEFRVGASGIYSDAPAGRWNFQGTSLAQLRSPELGPVQLELTGQLDVTRHFSARGVTVASGELRGYLRPLSGTTIWVGRLRGSASTLGGRRPLHRTQIGATTSFAGIEVGFSYANSTFDIVGNGIARGGTPTDSGLTAPVMPESGGARPPTRRMSMSDALLSTRWRVAGTDFDLAVGRRFGENTPQLTIWGVSGAYSLTSGLALVAGAGRAGSDPVTAVPGSRYLVMGLRLRLGPPTSTIVRKAPTATDRTPFTIGPALPAGREIVVRAPGATLVELAGDFTDWRPVALQPAGEGAWRLVLPIRPGLHRLAVRIDRGGWQAPPGARPIRSEFGGEVTEVVLD
jgi:hypothetical protein